MPITGQWPHPQPDVAPTMSSPAKYFEGRIKLDKLDKTVGERDSSKNPEWREASPLCGKE